MYTTKKERHSSRSESGSHSVQLKLNTEPNIFHTLVDAPCSLRCAALKSFSAMKHIVKESLSQEMRNLYGTGQLYRYLEVLVSQADTVLTHYTKPPYKNC